RLVRNLGATLTVCAHPSKSGNDEYGPAWKSRSARPEAHICRTLPLAKGTTLSVEIRLDICTRASLSMQGFFNSLLRAIGGYGYGTALERYLDERANSERITMVHGDQPLDVGLSMLLRQRIDTLVEDETVMRQKLANVRVQDKVRLAGYVPTSDRFSKVYIAFSPVNERSSYYAELLTQKMQQMRASGELEEVLARYHVTDWRK
ncbi:hypothetical protein SCD92_16200, partial [Gilvimarinus sp. SDUM040013]